MQTFRTLSFGIKFITLSYVTLILKVVPDHDPCFDICFRSFTFQMSSGLNSGIKSPL